MVAELDETALFYLAEKISFPDFNYGYLDILAYEDQIIAVVTVGKIDSLNKSGKIVPVTIVLTNNLEGVMSRICHSFIID